MFFRQTELTHKRTAKSSKEFKLHESFKRMEFRQKNQKNRTAKPSEKSTLHASFKQTESRQKVLYCAAQSPFRFKSRRRAILWSTQASKKTFKTRLRRPRLLCPLIGVMLAKMILSELYQRVLTLHASSDPLLVWGLKIWSSPKHRNCNKSRLKQHAETVIVKYLKLLTPPLLFTISIRLRGWTRRTLIDLTRKLFSDLIRTHSINRTSRHHFPYFYSTDWATKPIKTQF